MKLRPGFCIILFTFMALTACSTEAPAAAPLPSPTSLASLPPSQALSPTAPLANSATKAQPNDMSFFLTVPFDPAGNQVLTIKSIETAFMSIASTDTELPVESWTQLGWAMGNTLGEADQVPPDCALHFRTGLARQAYAACSGPAEVAIPHEGGDFVYIVFTDNNNRIARVVQTGGKYNPDATGLIP
jgi:hypothetical protein